MLIFLFVAVVLLFYKIKFSKIGFEDYLSKDNTTAIKGIFILLVFFSHFNSYVTFSAKTDVFYAGVIESIGQAMVTVFLFYSGYGIMESIKAKGDGYVKKIPVNRVLATLFRFDIAVCVFAVLSLILGNEITLKQFGLSLVAYSKVGNSNWYIFDMLALYVITYITFTVCKKLKLSNIKIQMSIFLILTFVFMIAIRLIKHNSWWYDTVLCYPLGMLWSINKNKIDKVISLNRNYAVLTLSAVIFTGIFKVLPLGIFSDICFHLSFVISVVLISRKVAFGLNPILMWLGNHLFEIYILMRIPMLICQKLGGLTEGGIYLSFVICMAVTLILAKLFKLLTDFSWKKLLKRA